MAAAMKSFNTLSLARSTAKTLRSVYNVTKCEDKSKNVLCSRCLCSHNATSSRYGGVRQGFDAPAKRKALRKIKTDVYTKNISNPQMEKAARERTLRISLADVQNDWIPKRYPGKVMRMATYYGIYDHMFNGVTFRPSVVMEIDYGDNIFSHYGNFIEPKNTSCAPGVKLTNFSEAYHSLIMVNLDGNFLSEGNEILHWLIGNIRNGDVSDGEVLSEYIPTFPAKGTGFHRFVFCLLKQDQRHDYEEIRRRYGPRNLKNRSFKTSDFLETCRGQLEPVGLSFFQATWDFSVSNTFREILGLKEPIYDLEPFLTPNQQKRRQVHDVFENKYTNM